MKRVYLSGAIEAKPDLTQLTSEGYPTDGNAQTSLPPTVPGAAWAHMIMEELMAVIEAAEIVPSRDTLTQLRDAIPKYVPAKFADGSINASKLTNATITYALLANALIAGASDVAAGTTVSNKLLTPAIGKTLVENILAQELENYAALAGAVFTGAVKGIEPVSDDDFVTLGYLKNAIQSVPPGTIIAFLGTDVPEGYLLCNGGTIQRSQYPNLVGPLGSVPACAGDGSTTLVLPNLNERFIEFSTTLSKIGQMVEPGLPNITGRMPSWLWAFYNRQPSGAFSKGETYAQRVKSGSGENVNTEAHEFHASLSSATYGSSSTVQPASVRFLPSIKT